MKVFKRQSAKIGMSPGSYVFLGEKKVDTVQISLLHYSGEDFEFHPLKEIGEALDFQKRKGVTWINIYGLHDESILKRVEEQFDIHPLVLEDVLNTAQRPKIEITDDHLFAVLKMITVVGDEEEPEIQIEQISLILRQNLVLCFQERKGDIFNALRERLKLAHGRLRQRGADYLAYAILDVVVDHYFLVLEKLGDYLETLDEEVTEEPDSETGEKINALKRLLITLRKNVWPLREVINTLTRDDNNHFKPATMPFLRDLYDHIIQVIDTTESYRELAGGIMDLYMSTMSNRLNETMKVLTIIATIFIPLSFLAGVFGMNFDPSASPYNMPELHYRYGYPVFWILVAVVSVIMLYYFKRKDWL